MSIVKMQKIRLTAHRADLPKILEVIQKNGCVEFSEIENLNDLKPTETDSFKTHHTASRLDFAVNFLSMYNPSSAIEKVLEGGRTAIKHSQLKEFKEMTPKLDLVVNDIQDIEKKLNSIKTKQKELEQEKRLLEEWVMWSVPLGSHFETDTATLFAISGNRRDVGLLEKRLADENILFDIQQRGERNYGLVIIKTDARKVEALFTEYRIEKISFPKRKNTVRQELKNIEKEKILLETEENSLKNQIEAIASEHLGSFKIASDIAHWEKDLNEQGSSSVHSQTVFVFEGWCPENKIADLEKEIEKTSLLFDMEKIEAREDETPPVELDNKSLVKPFEAVTRLYGLPGHKDLDPTLFLSGFFFIFFGFCLTDVGYGIFLVAVIGFLLWKYRVEKELKQLLVLLLMGGVSSVLLGFIFGGYLGIDMKLLPTFLQKLQIFDPIASPLPIFYFALILGFIQIYVGLILKIVRSAKNGEIKTGLRLSLPWLALFTSLGLYVGGFSGVIPQSIYYSYAAIASTIAIVITQGYAEKGIIKKAFKGLLSLYDSIGYFSDILSYSRLLALGLATSALALSINMIAELVRDMIPYIGFALMVVVLIVGHVFNIAVNVLGAFIHSARLQFVEFFGKFIEGSGRQFKPFRKHERFVTIVDYK